VRYVDFYAVSAEVSEKGSKVHIGFDELQKEKCVEFEAVNKHNNDQQAWIDAIKTVAKKNNYLYLVSHFPEFYKFRHMLNTEFEENANTGDIILFRSTHSAARAQQMFLNSEYGKQMLMRRSRWSCFEEQKE
jgi:phosphohistidine phosphatase SixA